MWRLSGWGVWISGCVSHIGIALGLCLRLRVSHLVTPDSNMSQVVRWVLSRRGCHALWRVVLIHAGCIRCGWTLNPTITALRYLVASHLVGSSPWLCWSLWISWSGLLLLAPNSPTSSSSSITLVPMVGVASVSWVTVVVGGHAIHSRVHIWGTLAGAILSHHSSSRGAGLIIACIRAMVVHLPQFRLCWGRPTAMHHPLVVSPASLVFMVQSGICLLGKRSRLAWD